MDLTFGVPLEGITTWLFQEGLRVGLIATLAYFTIRMTAVGIGHFEQIVSDRTKDSPDRIEFAERLHTISGLAIGFGAQNLVRDVISGFFLILEDQIHVGDVVSVDGTAGLVEAVSSGRSYSVIFPERCMSSRTAASRPCRT